MFPHPLIPVLSVPLDDIRPSTGLVYLASPYTSTDKLLVQYRQMCVEWATAEALRLGWMVYSPIAHCHNLAERYGLPGDAEFWENYNRVMIARADWLWVLALDGWERSSGVKGEIEFAESRGLPIDQIHIMPGSKKLMISSIKEADLSKGSPRAFSTAS